MPSQSLYNFDFPAAHADPERLHRHPSSRSLCPTLFAARPTCFPNSTAWARSKANSSPTTTAWWRKTRPQPEPTVRKQFLGAVSDAQNRAQSALKINPNDRDALFAMCVVSGMSHRLHGAGGKAADRQPFAGETIQCLCAAPAEARSQILRRVSDRRILGIHDRQPAVLHPLVRSFR